MVEAQKRYLNNPIHKERRAKYQKEYRQRPKVKERANALLRKRYRDEQGRAEYLKAYVRARQQSYEMKHTNAQWKALKHIYSHKCAYCGRKMKRLTKDHIIPISRGNPETVDKISNILPACQSCNSRKNAGKPPPYQIILATHIIMPLDA